MNTPPRRNNTHGPGEGLGPSSEPVSRGVAARVLVVEDNPVNQQVAQLMLEHFGYTVSFASSGDEAIEMVEATQYAAVLMDCRMPGTDGYEATRQIRMHHPDDQLPVIAFTADASDSDRRRCFEAGMNDFLTKPARATDLDEVLSRWIQRT
jgi:CheY-like chemotaxis protein